MRASKNSLSPTIQMRSSGFTLIEMMVTIAVLAIIVGIAAPSISTQLANQRVKSTTAILENALKEARAESLIRRQNVEMAIDSNDKKIEIELDDSTVIASYYYNTKSVIDGDDVQFTPNRTADEEMFTICDSNTATSARQVIVSAIGSITSQFGGTC